MEQGQGVGRVWERRNVVFHQILICGDSPESRGIIKLQDSIARTPLLRAMSAHNVMQALQDCTVELIIYHLSSRGVLMMNQPISVEEGNQHGLDIGLHPSHFLRSI